MSDYTMGGCGMGFGWLMPLIFIGIIFYFLNGNKKESSFAKEILDKRFASGEIDEEEYKAKKVALK